MQSIFDFANQHPILLGAIGTFIAKYAFDAFVSALPAPTAGSSGWQVFWFKFLNNLAANISRARGAHVESSPNWNAAVDTHIQKLQNGGPVQ